MFLIAIAICSTFQRWLAGIAAEPKAKLIDWMSIDGAMRRRRGVRFSCSMVTRASGAIFRVGARFSSRRIVAAFGVD
jgi:uncharacterized membrane protein